MSKHNKYVVDKGIMLSMPASLKGSLHGKQAFARAMFIATLAIALLQAQTIQTNAAEKRSYHVMNIKLYAYNKMEWNTPMRFTPFEIGEPIASVFL